jgi:hypothetical protein
VRYLALLLLVTAMPAVVHGQHTYDYGDAPDRINVCFGLAYPDIDVYGHFPTCGRTSAGKCSILGLDVVATESAIWLGANRDADPGGNGGQCSSAVTFPQYDVALPRVS